MNINYENYQKMIYKMAWVLAQKNPHLDINDLISQGNVAFCFAKESFDPDRGVKFSTHLWWKVRDLMGCTGVFNNPNPFPDNDEGVPAELDIPDESSPTPEREVAFRTSLQSLGDEAKEIVSLILGSSGEFCDFTARSVKVTQKNILEYLGSLNWTRRAAEGAMAEIKTMLKNL